MITTQILWIAVTIFVSIGLLAVGACIRSSQVSRRERQRQAQQDLCRLNQENIEMRKLLSRTTVLEALRDV